MSVTFEEEKRKVVNNVIKATVILGAFTTTVVFLRDTSSHVSILNSIVNAILVISLLTVLLLGNLVKVEAKAWFVIAAFVFVGSKGLLVNGQAGHTFGFFLFSVMVSLLIFKPGVTRWVIILSTTIYFIISMLLGLHYVEPILSTQEFYTQNSWIVELSIYVFLLFIIIAGVGRMQTSFQRSIHELDESNQRLNQYNEELRNQLEFGRQMENKASEKESHFKALFDESNDGIIVCDACGMVLEVNPSVCKLVDYPKSYLIGNYTTQFVVANDKETIQSMAVDKIHRARIREVNLLGNGGVRIPVEVNYSVIQYNEQKAVLVTVRDIRERKETEEKVLSAVINAEENERSRFAKDLHDDLGPILSSIKMYIQSLRRFEDTDDKKDLINRLITTVDDSIKSIRKISYNLSSHLLQNMGLTNALETHAERIRLGGTFEVDFQHNFPQDFRLPANIEIVVYRVILELINNSVTHSHGNRIDIGLRLQDNHFFVDYADNGTGFDVDRMLTDNTKGIGLKNILSRIKSIKGLSSYPSTETGFSLSIDINL
ncbi:MAG TPA: PAS domain S-box protein [Chryseolinea sp.]|nr:PAS domain S-box protein [Chryseolinea sp.]